MTFFILLAFLFILINFTFFSQIRLDLLGAFVKKFVLLSSLAKLADRLSLRGRVNSLLNIIFLLHNLLLSVGLIYLLLLGWGN